MSVRTITVEPATRETLAPFGDIVSVDKGMAHLPSPFYDGKVRVFRPAGFTTDSDAEIAVALVDRRPLTVEFMERHFKHTQMFVPLEGKPFVAVLAPPNDKDLPDLDEARAFLFDGSGGFSMHIGTWHEFPFALVDDTQFVVLLRNETTTALRRENVIEGEGVGPDLDKKNIVRRLGTTIEAKF